MAFSGVFFVDCGQAGWYVHKDINNTRRLPTPLAMKHWLFTRLVKMPLLGLHNELNFTIIMHEHTESL